MTSQHGHNPWGSSKVVWGLHLFFCCKFWTPVKTLFKTLPRRCSLTDTDWALVTDSMASFWSLVNDIAWSRESRLSDSVPLAMSIFSTIVSKVGGQIAAGGFGRGLLSYRCRKQLCGASVCNIWARSLVTFLFSLYFLLADMGENMVASCLTDAWWSSSPSTMNGWFCLHMNISVVQFNSCNVYILSYS